MATNFREFGGNVKISSNLEVGTANLFVDTLTSSVGIGTTEPGKRFHIKHDDNSATGLLIENTNTGNEGRPFIQFNNDNTDAYVQLNGPGRSEPNSFQVLSDADALVVGNDDIFLQGSTSFHAQLNGTNRKSITSGATYLRGREDDYFQQQYRLFVWDISPGGDNRSRQQFAGASWFVQRPDHNRSGKCSFGFGSGQPSMLLGIGNSAYWFTQYNQGVSNRFYYNWQGQGRGYLETNGGGQMNFTGQHRTFLKDIPTCKADAYQGLIASSNNDKYIRMDKCVETGSNAITINETLPVVSLSNVAYDKTCFGVISTTEDPETRVILMVHLIQFLIKNLVTLGFI